MNEADRIHAPELDAGTAWLNSDRPLRLAHELRGKVVLLDFWTYCCINCLHLLPHLARLEAKHGHALAVIGVHSAKFTTEKNTENVRRAVLRHGIEHPVVCDPDHALWSRYTVSAWPTQVVVDPEGYVVGQVSGEGHHELVDQTIGELIEKFRARGLLDERPLPLARERAREAARALCFPGKVLADTPSRRLFIADSGNHRLVVAGFDGEVTDIIGSGQPGAADGDYTAASFRNPQGMAIHGETLYVADTDNHLVRRVDLAGRQVETLLGNGTPAEELNQIGSGRDVALRSPWDLTLVEGRGAGVGRRYLFIAMAGSHQIWIARLEDLACYPFAGTAHEGLNDGHRSEASLAQPSGIAHHRRWLFVADSEVSAVRCINLEDDHVSTVVGEGLFTFGDADGAWEKALLQHPLGIAVDGPTVYVADTYNHKLKAIDLTASQIRTVAGDGVAGLADGNPGRFFEPAGVSIAGERLFVADTNNHAIRVVDRETLAVSTLTLRALARDGETSAGHVTAPAPAPPSPAAIG